MEWNSWRGFFDIGVPEMYKMSKKKRTIHQGTPNHFIGITSDLNLIDWIRLYIFYLIFKFI